MSIRRAILERETPVRNALLGSLVGHILLLLLVLLTSYLWGPSTLLLGGAVGGGSSSDLISVGLLEELSGGAGMYKPGIVPRPQVAAPPPTERKVEQAEPEPDEPVFVEKKLTSRPESPDPVRNSGVPKKTEETPSEGVIPQPAQPGSGGRAATSPGSGGGLGGGLGIQIGEGSPGSGVASWYVRQLEQRVGQNWLRTSLQGLNQRVRTEISFEVGRNGVIENIEIIRPSGVRSVDQAARRAVLASSPLPPLPVELRRRTLRVMAVFEYPPP